MAIVTLAIDPAVVGPGPAHRPEHVAAEDPGTDPGEALLRHRVVGAGLATPLAKHLAPGSGVDEPFHPFGPAHAQRILQILVGPGAIAVDGNGEAQDAEFGHRGSPGVLPAVQHLAAICDAVSRPNMRFVPPKSAEQQSQLLVHRARQESVVQRTARVN